MAFLQRAECEPLYDALVQCSCQITIYKHTHTHTRIKTYIYEGQVFSCVCYHSHSHCFCDEVIFFSAVEVSSQVAVNSSEIIW